MKVLFLREREFRGFLELDYTIEYSASHQIDVQTTSINNLFPHFKKNHACHQIDEHADHLIVFIILANNLD